MGTYPEPQQNIAAAAQNRDIQSIPEVQMCKHSHLKNPNPNIICYVGQNLGVTVLH